MLGALLTLAADGALLIALLPLGLLVLWLTEKILGIRSKILLTERLILSLYTSGAVLWVVASIPTTVYSAAVVTALMIVGVAGGLAVLVHGRRWPDVLRPSRVLESWTGLAICALTVALLAIETFPVLGRSFPNAWDGSETALWVTLTLRNHTLPWTLAPYTLAGVTYPMGTSVWMTLPVMLFANPVVASPILVPPLFLALTVPAAFAWGFRLAGGFQSPNSSLVGLVFAAFFGLVASWPRLEVGGSYDFAIAMPPLLVLAGLLHSFAQSGLRNWNLVLAFGLSGGVLVTLSLVAGEAFILLLVSALIASRKWRPRDVGIWIPRVLVIAGITLAFTWRSLAGLAMWSQYPGGVRTQVGTASYTPPSFFGAFNWGLVQGELDPFVPWKSKMSPVPLLSLELQVLLVLGIGVVVAGLVWPKVQLIRSLPQPMTRSLCWNSVCLGVAASVLVLTVIPNSVIAVLGSLSNLDEMSVLWFLSLQSLAALPVVVAALALEESWGTRRRAVRSSEGDGQSVAVPSQVPRPRSSDRPRRSAVVVAVILVVSLGVGVLESSTAVPDYIYSDVAKTSNVTAGDVAVLAWVGAHLPACSSVLVAPGSAGQFLPEYATVHLVYQMTPSPLNYSYDAAIVSLTGGTYSSTTRSELLSIGVTEVFASGETSVEFPPISTSTLAESPDFQLLFGDGEAGIFAFEPGITSSACPP